MRNQQWVTNLTSYFENLIKYFKKYFPFLTHKKVAAELQRSVFPKFCNSFVVTKMHNEEKSKIFSLGEYIEIFVDYLALQECKELLKWNKMSIDINTESIFFDNINSGESIFDCVEAQ